MQRRHLADESSGGIINGGTNRNTPPTEKKGESCLEKETMQGTMAGARKRGSSRTAWMDNINTWTGLLVEESVRITEDRDKWRKNVHGVANPQPLRRRMARIGDEGFRSSTSASGCSTPRPRPVTICIASCRFRPDIVGKMPNEPV